MTKSSPCCLVQLSRDEASAPYTLMLSLGEEPYVSRMKVLAKVKLEFYSLFSL